MKIRLNLELKLKFFCLVLNEHLVIIVYWIFYSCMFILYFVGWYFISLSIHNLIILNIVCHIPVSCFIILLYLVSCPCWICILYSYPCFIATHVHDICEPDNMPKLPWSLWLFTILIIITLVKQKIVKLVTFPYPFGFNLTVQRKPSCTWQFIENPSCACTILFVGTYCYN